MADQEVVVETTPEPTSAATAGLKEQALPGKTYTQEELDRITAKVRKNARYLGRKEAESELLRTQAPSKREEQSGVRETQPGRDEFESYEDYLVAKASHEARNASREEHEKRLRADREQSAAERRAKAQGEFRQRAQAVVKDIPDFEEVIDAAGEVMISSAMSEAIQESPIGPRILYFLAKDHVESMRIAELSPSAAAREIGKLEARIESGLKKLEPSKKEPSKPLEPIEPVGGHSATTDSAPSDKDDIETWMRKRDAQVRARFKRK